MPSLHLLALFFLLQVLSQDAPEQPKPQKAYRSEQEELKLLEKWRRNEVRIHEYNFRTYNFKLNRSSEFLLKPEEDQLVKAIFDVYWNKDDLYRSADVLEGEELQLLVLSANGNILISEAFHTAMGFTFNVTGGSTYRLQFKENGTQHKIVMMHLSETLVLSNRTAKRDAMQKIEAKLELAERKIKNGLEMSSAGVMIEASVNEKIQRQSTTFSHFEILEALLIVLASMVEVKLVTGLLKSDIVV